MKINSNMMAWLLAGALVASLSLHLSGGVAKSSAPTNPGSQATVEEISIPMEVLGLSETQVSTLREFCEEDCACKPSVEQSLADVTDQLELALMTEPMDPAYVRQLGRQLAGLRAKRIESCIESILLVRDVLHPEQIEELRSSCRMRMAR